MFNKILLIILMICSLYLMDFNQTMSPNWIGPYLSAAANFDYSSFDMYVDFSEIHKFSLLSNTEKFSYSFPSSNNVILYDYLAKGYLLILLLSKKIFFFVGDLDSLKYLQYVVHICISLSIISILDEKYKKIMFFILYSINPIVLYFVNFPFYYFWQVVPSYIFLYYYVKNKEINNKIFILTLIFFLIYMTRPTVLFIIIFFYFLYAYRENFLKSFIAILIFLGLSFGIKSNSIGPWHTMYIGIGAYTNSYNITLSDNQAYKFFYNKTGKVMNSFNVTDKSLHEEYYAIMEKEYFAIVKSDPMMIIKNATLNVLQSYSFGYKVGNIKIVYLSIFIGMIIVTSLLYFRQYILFFAIGLAGGTFTLYYPPIPAYMFGSYILIVFAIINIFHSIKNLRIKNNVKNN